MAICASGEKLLHEAKVYAVGGYTRWLKIILYDFNK